MYACLPLTTDLIVITQRIYIMSQHGCLCAEEKPQGVKAAEEEGWSLFNSVSGQSAPARHPKMNMLSYALQH